MTTRYVSAAGDDTNDGTLSAPWRTVTRLNTAFAAGQFGRGDSALFERGGTYYGKLRQPDSINPSLPGWLRIGAYGDDPELPVISGYKILNIAGGWSAFDANTWQINLSAAGVGTVYTGYDSAQGGGDVGFLKVDGVIYGRRRFSTATLSGQWDFHYSGTTLYVRSSANPTTLAGDIRASVDGDGSNMRSGVELADVAITGHGGQGVSAPGVGGSTRCRVLRCHIFEIGGSTLDGFGDGTIRYGNGIQGWIRTQDMHVEGNTIHDCYDVAISIQGGSAGVTETFSNVTFRRNLFYRNSQSMEFWYGGEGPGFDNCVAEYNTCLFAGYGWGGEVRPETQSRVHLLTFQWGGSADLTIRRNIFYDGRAAYRYTQTDPTGMDCTRNIILQRPGGLMNWQDPETIEQAAVWAAADGRDIDSRFVVLPASSDTNISDADITAALTYLDSVPDGQIIPTQDGPRLFPIHGPWR